MQRVMLATDFSERSDRAKRRAALLARAAGATLDLVHVVDDDQPRRIVENESVDAQVVLDEIARSIEADERVSCTTRVVLADPFAGILQAAEDSRPDLLVLGAHRRQVLRDVFVGTTAERTIRSATCPVLLVNCFPRSPYRSVLLTTDLSENSRMALQSFERLSIGADALLAVVHVFEAPAMRLTMSSALSERDRERYLGELHAEARRDLSEFMAAAGGRSTVSILRPNETTVAQAILAATTEAASDLVVVSTHCKGVLTRNLLGSVTEQILRFSSVDVLAVPPPR